MTFDHKKHSLGQVENFLYDAMSSGATPQEIYDVIKGVVEDNYYTYKKSTSEAYELLALLNGNGQSYEDVIKEKEYYEPSMPPWGHSDLEALKYTDEELNAMCDAAEAKDKVKKWVLPVQEVEGCDECIINFPDDLLEAAKLKEGDTVEWVDQGDGSFILKKCETKKFKGLPSHGQLMEDGYKTYEEAAKDGWSMTDDGFWIKE